MLSFKVRWRNWSGFMNIENIIVADTLAQDTSYDVTEYVK